MFRIFCDQKGCRKEMSPVLDKADNKVYCTECDKEIANVTEFMKNQMVSLGQIKRQQKQQQAFSVKCIGCGKENPPVLKGKDLVCSVCNHNMDHLSAPFALAIKDFLRVSPKK